MAAGPDDTSSETRTPHSGRRIVVHIGPNEVGPNAIRTWQPMHAGAPNARPRRHAMPFPAPRRGNPCPDPDPAPCVRVMNAAPHTRFLARPLPDRPHLFRGTSLPDASPGTYPNSSK